MKYFLKNKEAKDLSVGDAVLSPCGLVLSKIKEINKSRKKVFVVLENGKKGSVELNDVIALYYLKKLDINNEKNNSKTAKSETR
jgi:cytidine deaminase